MGSNLILSDSRDRARSAAATAAIHLALGTAFLTGLALQPQRQTDESLKTFDVAPPPLPPPPITRQQSPAPTDKATPAGKKADPNPIVAPPVRLPNPQPIAAAPVAGAGSSASAGAAANGRGTGAGGAGDGRGGSGGIGAEARLISGNRGRVARHLLRPFAADNGYAYLLLTISESGRVTGCGVTQGTGSAAVDQALCQVMFGQSRWVPARDTAGRPISVQVRWTATWRK